MSNSRDWKATDIPQSVIDFEQRLIENISKEADPPLGTKKTMQNPQAAIAVLKGLIEECETNNIMYLPIGKLKQALERWL